MKIIALTSKFHTENQQKFHDVISRYPRVFVASDNQISAELKMRKICTYFKKRNWKLKNYVQSDI